MDQSQKSSKNCISLIGAFCLGAPCSPSNLSSVTLIGTSPSDDTIDVEKSSVKKYSPKTSPTRQQPQHQQIPAKTSISTPTKSTAKTLSPTKDQGKPDHQKRPSVTLKSDDKKPIQRGVSVESEDQSDEPVSSHTHSHRASCSSSRSASISTTTGVIQVCIISL